MTVADDASGLLDRLAGPLNPGVALLELFEFCVAHREATWGWVPLGDDQIDGYALHRVIARARTTLREAFLQQANVTGVGDLIGIASSLRAIAGSGSISQENSAEIVRGMRAIDDALRGFHAARVVGSSDTMEAARLRSRLRAGQPLAATDKFAVYPRPLRQKRPERGQGDPGMLLNHVAVLARTPEVEVRFLVRLQSELADDAQFKRVGVIPTIHDHRELAWEPVGTSRYRIEENAEAAPAVHERVVRALSEMARQQTQVVLMPELVSGPGLRTAVSTHLAQIFLDGGGAPVITLCGTSFEAEECVTRNQAIVLDAEGDILWVQNKLHAFSFSADEQRALGLPLGERPMTRQEAIAVVPSTLVVVDLSSGIRAVVLICEDLIQSRPHAAAVQQMAVTTVLTPIMDRSPEFVAETEIHDPGWLKDGALAFIRHPVASTFIANSGALVVKNRDKAWAYAHAFTVPRCTTPWRAVTTSADGQPTGWVLDLS